MATEDDNPIKKALRDTVRVPLDIYEQQPDEPRAKAADEMPTDTAAGIASALLTTSPGAELLAVSRTVGLSISGLSFELPPEVLQQITEEVIRQVRAELLAGAGSESEFLDTKEAAAFLRSSPQRVYDLVSKRHLRPEKDGSRNLFRRSDLEDYLRGTKRARR